jgi:HSP20 family protein
MLTLRHSPFDLFERLDQQLASAERVPAAEVHETDDAYEISLELPGVDKASIDVKATDRTLMVSAERQSLRQTTPQLPENGDPQAAAARTGNRGPLLSEFRYGTWSRSFRFPAGIQRDGLEAHYRDGLLHVKAPKAQMLTTVNVKVEG